jgi:hypothetical protein
VKGELSSGNMPGRNNETRRGLEIVGVRGKIRTENLPNTAVANLRGKTV